MSSATTRQSVRICWLCGEEIIGKSERHHVKPRRYFKRRDDHRRDNLVKVHTECHRRFHKEVEDCRWKWWEFEKNLAPINFGEGVFAGD